jgi:hypothetical protein
MAKEVVNCLGPSTSGNPGVILPLGQPQVGEGVYFKASSPGVVADTSPVSLAERGEIQHPVTLLPPAAPTALAEPAPEASSENPAQDGGHTTGKGEGNEKDCHTGWEDTPNFREEWASGKLTREVRSLWRNTETN